MSEHNQKQRPNLSQLYRRFAGSHVVAAVPEADDLLELARVAHAEEAASPLCADLLRFSRELEPVSARLSDDVEAVFERAAPATHHRIAARRHAAAGARRWRGVAAVAASMLLAVVGAWVSLKQPASPLTTARTEAAALNAPAQDRIFAGLDQHAMHANALRDEIFNADFPSDVIFSSREHGG